MRIDEHCLGSDVDRSRISSDAEIIGASWITGKHTEIAAGAVIRNTRIHNACIGPGAVLEDSIVVAEGKPHSHKCDTAGRTVVSGAERPTIDRDARIVRSILINTSAGAATSVTGSWLKDCKLGSTNALNQAKVILTNSGANVTVIGPTEVSEAFLGHGAVIDRRGYLEGIFSNVFPKVVFDESAGALRVVETIDLPHVSRYGINTINSTNSGKLLAQPENTLKGFGPCGSLWYDPLLSHEQVELGPCCWVAPWTKVIGQSPEPHETDNQLVNDALTTYVMPFAMAGVDGATTQGLVMPGELAIGFGPKQRKGGWVFTYAPGAVIAMVHRLYEALAPERKAIADTIVNDAIETAVQMTKAMAAQHGMVLSLDPNEQRRGWPRWIGTTYALLTTHRDNGLWAFADGKPVEWRKESGRWMHPRFDQILALAPDALESQVDEDVIFDCDDPVPSVRMVMSQGAIAGTNGAPKISPEADVAEDAFIGSGCCIGAGAVIESGAVLWNSVVESSTVGEGARMEGALLENSSVGARSLVRACRITNSSLGKDSSAEAACVSESRLGPETTLSSFADLKNVRTEFGTILGGTFHSVDIESYLMSMHMAGGCCHLKAKPLSVTLDTGRVEVPAIPMLGGGSLTRGTKEAPVTIESCFIGSNAILEPNTHVGFGSFVLGTLGPDAGILPFTLSVRPDPKRHQIGAVLTNMPSVIITHFINWTYHAVGAGGAPAVARMVRQAIQDGIRAIEWKLGISADNKAEETFAKYRSLKHYGEAQLRSGLDVYRHALDSGAWDLAYENGCLRFASEKGVWLERNGSAFWQAAQSVEV